MLFVFYKYNAAFSHWRAGDSWRLGECTYILSVGCVYIQPIIGIPTVCLLPEGRRRGKEQLIIGSSFILSERSLLLMSVFLRGDSLFWGSKAALMGPSSVWLAGRTDSPEDATSKPGCREVCAAGTVAAQPWAVWHGAGAQYALCCVFLSGVVVTSTCNWWGPQARLKYTFSYQVICCFWKSQWNFWWKDIVLYGWRCYHLAFCFLKLKPNYVPPVFSLMAIVLLLSEFHLSLLRWEVSGSLFVHNFKILLELLLCFPFASSLTRMALCDKGGKKRVYENIVWLILCWTNINWPLIYLGQISIGLFPHCVKYVLHTPLEFS